MPELPEVETIVRDLRRAIVGKTLANISVLDEKLKKPGVRLPQKISAVRRHGKYIVLELVAGEKLILHLRMTGRLSFERRGANRKARIVKSKHKRATFLFSDGLILHFLDVRRFGTLDWQRNGGALPPLGIGPFSPHFAAKSIAELLGKTRRAIKSMLLDQKIISGIGNIYADESLWLAKINPKKKSGNLSAAEIGRLVFAVKRILREAIKKGGFTLRDYRRVDGSSGNYQNSRRVYGREGLPCKRCRARIKRRKVGGRSSYYCPKCQKLENRKIIQ